MKKGILVIGCLIGTINFSFSQTAPGIEWQNTIGGSDDDYFNTVYQTSDGGYILGGYSWSNISGDKTEDNLDSLCIPYCTTDYWIVKTDGAGNIQWQNTIGGTNHDLLSLVKQTVDGGYIIGGTSPSNISGDKTENSHGGNDYWVVKIDGQGNIEWQNTIGGNGWDQLYSIQQTIDGGYILAGYSDSNISGDKTENSNGAEDYWIVKTDTLGNIQWQNTIGGNNEDYLTSIHQTYDGGYFLGGSSNSNISGDKSEDSNGEYDYWIVKTDTLGNIQWQNTIGGSDTEWLYSIQQTTDAGYIIGGYSLSDSTGDKLENSIGVYDYWLVKIDILGNIQWQNTIGGNNTDALHSIQQTSDGGYIFGGWSNSDISGDKTENSNGGFDYWVVKTDVTGNIQWQNTIGGSYDDLLNFIQQTFDSGYILGGYSVSNISGDKTENCLGNWDYWVIKLAPDTITGIPNLQSSNSNLQIFSNPFTTTLTLTNTIQKGELIIFDVTGTEILRTKTFSEETTIDTAHLTPGFYFINYREENRNVNKKVVKL